MSSIKEIKQFYDDATFRKLHGFVYSNIRVEYAWQGLNEIFDFIIPDAILEIGSGIGEISHRLASKFPLTEITGFDISEQSIKIASSLFVLPNLSFVRGDNISEVKFPENKKFDVIFLMDVYEHIPEEERNKLHDFIRVHISEKGFVFLSCPTPQHLAYLRVNIPTEIQPVDVDIHLTELLKMSQSIQKKLVLYKEISVFRAGDYFHSILSDFLRLQDHSTFKKQSGEQSIGLKKEIIKKIRQKKIIKPPVFDNASAKKDLIRKMLGEEILEKVEKYKY